MSDLRCADCGSIGPKWTHLVERGEGEWACKHRGACEARQMIASGAPMAEAVACLAARPVAEADLPMWLVTDFDATASGKVNAVWVKAETAEEAANEALPDLTEGWDTQLAGEFDSLFVVRVDDRTAFWVAKVARFADLQCCGGIGDGSQHSALCPLFERPEAT